MTLRTARVAFLVAGSVLGAGAAAAQQMRGGARPALEPPAPRLRVEIVAGTVGVEACDVAVRDLLAEFARRTGLEVAFEGALDEPITMRFERLPVRAALERILDGRNFALRYVEPAAGPGGSIDARASRLWVFDPRPAEEGARPPGTAASPPPAAVDGPLKPQNAALAGGDARARLRAVSDLIEAGGDEAAAELALLASSDPDPRVRREAVYGLGEIGEEAGLEVVEQALGDPDSGVREAAVEAVADRGGRGAVAALAAVLGDQDPALREQAVYALGELGGGDAIRLLRQALADEHRLVRAAAAEVLDELSER